MGMFKAQDFKLGQEVEFTQLAGKHFPDYRIRTGTVRRIGIMKEFIGVRRTGQSSIGTWHVDFWQPKKGNHATQS